eukprot:Blabericola_migrator_1__6480@NODE_326_length_9761_cov_41_862080_g263_i0_p2_GENE_NODE_326_length_9761_cov_41_862080_g263_i0NODE_326_length_9761_cov_41_862080_g263_i0_p2_ORF_typecomplete_len850_score65_87Peptidase_S8/PF00082_22/3_6e68EGF_CA/PF07645_15/0_0008EGF_CA/PF07645_15/77EGF_CA/PF07645_15/3_4e14EGF_MSP1_1/PF12946_7/2_7e06EGF_MSP1_1/PF12946_7/57EGF_MSP1_1/PF12946_7/0_0018EGF_3/PF12947_7/0_16EGF_3/PF12947_7/5e03EGF_3/PF12947_7/1_4e07FXa_inhibition/PF14670_6/0_17FXa_inhibition/PF14670_6/9_7e02F
MMHTGISMKRMILWLGVLIWCQCAGYRLATSAAPLPPAAHLKYLNHVSEASSDFLLAGRGKQGLFASLIGHDRRFLRQGAEAPSSLQQTSSVIDTQEHRVSQTVLVSYRFPKRPSPIEHTRSERPSRERQPREYTRRHPMSGMMSTETPYRVLQTVREHYNISQPITSAEDEDVLEDRSANIVTRNMVLARLFQSLQPANKTLLVGLQKAKEGLPFNCSYLTGLHMEVMSADKHRLTAEDLRSRLLQDPFVEDVWVDEILEGEDFLPQSRHVNSSNYDDRDDLERTMPLEGSARGSKHAVAEVSIPASSPISTLANLPNVQRLPGTSNGGTRDDSDGVYLFEPLMKGVSASPNDTFYSDQWGHHHAKFGINSPSVWQEWTGEGTDFVVALVDSGVDLDHPDLRNQYWRNKGETDCFDGIDNDGNGYVDDCLGWDWVDNDNVPQDENGHGTASAGIIAASANNGLGVAGVCWGCRLMVLRTLDKDIRGTISGFIKAIDYAVVQGVKVSNNSYGGRGSSFASLKTAVRRARKQGMIFVAAAGNYGSNNDLTAFQPTYPASYNDTNIISVAAIDNEGNLAPFSCYGKKSVDIAAPGVRILSTGLGNRYTHMDGTSFATPFVSAAAALLWSWQPELSADDVISRLLTNVRKIPSLHSRVTSGGTLDLYGAIFQHPGTRPPSNELQHVDDPPPFDLQTARCEYHDLCPENSDCVDTAKGLRCRCRIGFRHVKGRCVSNNQCSMSDASRQCKSTELCDTSGTGSRCICRPGFARENGHGECLDIDECALDTYICPREATCLNTQGSFDCQCPSGFKWNGLAWVQRGASCELDRKMVSTARRPNGNSRKILLHSGD